MTRGLLPIGLTTLCPHSSPQSRAFDRASVPSFLAASGGWRYKEGRGGALQPHTRADGRHPPVLPASPRSHRGTSPAPARPGSRERLCPPAASSPGAARRLGQAAAGVTRCPQGPSAPRPPRRPLLQQARRLGGVGGRRQLGTATVGTRAESPAGPSPTSAGTARSGRRRQGSRPAVAALIFKVATGTEVTSSLGSCPPACPLGLGQMPERCPCPAPRRHSASGRKKG